MAWFGSSGHEKAVASSHRFFYVMPTHQVTTGSEVGVNFVRFARAILPISARAKVLCEKHLRCSRICGRPRDEGGFRADYANKDAKATLWVGQAKDAVAAEALTQSMAEKISVGNAMFQDLQELSIGNRLIFTVTGQGQQHFFYAMNNKIVWLAIDSSLAPDALHSLWGALK